VYTVIAKNIKRFIWRLFIGIEVDADYLGAFPIGVAQWSDERAAEPSETCWSRH